jgi:hypothetical protein
VTRRTARRIDDREAAGAIDFDAALEAYLYDGDPEDLLRAAGLVSAQPSRSSLSTPRPSPS